MTTSHERIESGLHHDTCGTGTPHVSIRQGTYAVEVRITAPSIGQYEAPMISDEIVGAIGRASGRCQWLALDLSGVSVLSSMGLALCLEVRRTAKDRGMGTAIYGMNAHLRGLFQVMKVERLYKLVHSKDDLRRLTEG